MVPLTVNSPLGPEAPPAEINLPILLPHELWAAAFGMGPDRWVTTVLGGPLDGSSVAEWWRHMVQHSGWARNHPVVVQTEMLQYLVPLSLYGDSARVTRDDSVTVLTFTSPLAADMKRPTIDTRLMIAAVPTTYLREDLLVIAQSACCACCVTHLLCWLINGHMKGFPHGAVACPRLELCLLGGRSLAHCRCCWAPLAPRQ